MQALPSIFHSITSTARAARPVLATLLCVLLAPAATAQGSPNPMDVSPPDGDPQRTDPLGAFQIVDNIYSVGARIHNPVWLITSDEGHILLDTSYERYVPGIVENIERLGFDPEDVEIILASHAHSDHVEGHAAMQEITGALIVNMAEDVDVIESGGETDFRERSPWRPAEVDRVIHDLDRVRVGDVVMTAHLTPGHTRGCTTWTTVVEYRGEPHDVVFYCGMRINTNETLLGNRKFPNAAEAFAYGFAKLKTLPVDFFLGMHGYWFDFENKIEEMERGGGAEVYLDPEGYQYKLNSQEQAYIEQLARERAILPARER